MTGLPAKTDCRMCGAPRDPKCNQALCVECAKVWRKEQKAKHGAGGEQKLRDAYERLRVRELLDARPS